MREEFFKTSLVLFFLVLIFSKKSFFLITSFNFFNHQSRNQKNWIKLLNMLSKFKTLHSFLSPVLFRLSLERSNSSFCLENNFQDEYIIGKTLKQKILIFFSMKSKTVWFPNWYLNPVLKMFLKKKKKKNLSPAQNETKRIGVDF